MPNPKVFINPKSGSIRLTGTVDIVDSEGNVIESIENPKFCGCGYSKDKPWCDGSHKKITQPAQALENARATKTEIEPFAPETAVAIQIRERLVSARIEKQETIVGLKVGGALESAENQTGVMIYGYLTDAMDVSRGLVAADYIYPRAEAEVVFKISKEISAPITIDQVLEHVDQVSVGMEIFDYRYGQAQIYANDAIADNAGAAAYVYSHWVAAHEANLENLTAQVFANEIEIETAPLTAIRGNPWLALVLLSKVLVENGVRLPAGSVVFSGSATKAIHLAAGNNYALDIKGLGRVELKAI